MIIAVLMRPFHKLRPDGQRRFCALKLQILIIIHAYPDQAKQLCRKPGEPSIMGRTGLARRRERKAT